MKTLSEANRAELTQRVKDVARQWGAVLVGVAPIERYDPTPPYHDRAPKGHDPRDMVPNAKSVISVAQPIMNPVQDTPAVLMEKDLEMVPPDAKNHYLEIWYQIPGHRTQDYMLEHVGQMVGQTLLAEGFQSMLFPTAGVHPRVGVLGEGVTQGRTYSDREVWEGPNRTWRDLYSPFGFNFGPMSHRHAATRAGLGEFGYNNLVLTPQFGPRQRFNTIVTDAELVPDPLINEPICLRDKCLLCMKACYMDAITFRDDLSSRDYRQVDEVDKTRIFVDTPVRTNAMICTRRKDRVVNPPVRGDCVRICPLPSLSNNLPQRLQEIIEEWRPLVKSDPK